MLAALIGLVAWRLLAARGEQRIALAWLVGLLAWSTVALALAAPGLQTVVAGLPNDHYHASLDPVVAILFGVSIAALLERGLAAWRRTLRDIARRPDRRPRARRRRRGPRPARRRARASRPFASRPRTPTAAGPRRRRPASGSSTACTGPGRDRRACPASSSRDGIAFPIFEAARTAARRVGIDHHRHRDRLRPPARVADRRRCGGPAEDRFMFGEGAPVPDPVHRHHALDELAHRPVRRLPAHRDLGLPAGGDAVIGILRRHRRLIDVCAASRLRRRPRLRGALPTDDRRRRPRLLGGRRRDPYTRPVATQDAFTYPPPAALFFAGLRAVTLQLRGLPGALDPADRLRAAVAHRPVGLGFLVIPVVVSDLYLGNIHVLLGAAIVASLRWPAAVGVPLLTKPTVRRRPALVPRARRVAPSRHRARDDRGRSRPLTARDRPRPLAEVDRLRPGDTGALADVGARTGSPMPLLVRLPAAALLVVWGARTEPPLDAARPARCSPCRSSGSSAWPCSPPPSPSPAWGPLRAWAREVVPRTITKSEWSAAERPDGLTAVRVAGSGGARPARPDHQRSGSLRGTEEGWR